jgi:hypothetical protein
MRIIPLLILMTFLNKGYTQKLELWVSSPNVIVGEKINFTLSISGIDTLDFIKSKKGQFKFITENKFRYSFEISPEYSGRYEIGPFSITYEGEELISNAIEMNVIEPGIKALTITLELPEKVKQNEETMITFIGGLSSLTEINLTKSKNFEIISSRIITNLAFKDGKSIKVIKKSFVVKFLQKGDFVVNESWLESLREYSTVESKTVRVN